ncbi:MAG: saccharopine dehydrogenase NADP-binding domain-containing protein [Chloroflexota bacterium]
MSHKIVVLGGYGAFGRNIALDLAKLPDVALVVAGRTPTKGAALAASMGADVAFCDLKDPASVHTLVKDAFLLIHAAGPFWGAGHAVAKICLEHGVHYLDLGDEREHVAGIVTLNEAAQRQGLFLGAGVSTTPGITSAMVHHLAADGLRIRAVHSVLAPGNQNPRGTSTVATVLGYLGRSIPMTIDGRPVTRRGWFDGEVVTLPAPVGRRRVYTVDTPDLALFPAHFGAQTVTFKAGMELNVMNYGLALLARLQRRRKFPPLVGLARLFTALSWLLYPLGSPHGAVAVWVEGEQAGERCCRSLAIVAPAQGPLVAAAPAIVLARQLLDKDRPLRPGAYPCLGLFTFEALMAYLQPYGLRAVRGDENGWQAGDSVA